MNFLPGNEIKIENDNLILPKDVYEQYQKFGINSLFDWQSECLKLPGVLDGTKNLVYSAPTSAGKTLVSEIILLKRVLKTKRKVLFVLPYVSVSREKMIYFKKLFSGIGLKVDGFMGNSNPKGGLAVLDVAICTIEKANSLVNRMIDEEWLDQLSLIVIDELHMLGDSHRGYILELLLTKVLYHSRSMSNISDSKLTQIVGMSATLPNLGIVSDWLRAALYICQFRPIPLLEMIKCESKIYDCQDINKPMKLFRAPEGVSTKDEGQVIALCLETVLDGHGCLIFCPTKAWCETLSVNIATEILRLCRIAERDQLENGHKLREIVSKPELEECVENLKKCPSGLDDQLGKVVPFGVAFHHAGLTTEERDIIETYYREGHIRTLIATSTLSSGVNLPARRVIIRTPTFNKTFIDHMTYKQMIGRAGRKGIDVKGESVIVCKAQEFERLKTHLSLGIQPIKSCLDRNDSLSMKRALLEVIVPRVVHTVGECIIYLKSSFLQYVLDDRNTMKNQSEEDDQAYKVLVFECLKYLEKSDLITISVDQSVDGSNKQGRPKKNRSEKSLTALENDDRIVNATPLGHAVLSASLGPEDGLTIFHELDRARRSLVLDTDLHLIYLLTPVYLDVGTSINWSSYLQIVSSLPDAEVRVMKVVGINERFINKCERYGMPKLESTEFQVHKRFFSALILFYLVNERPFSEIIDMFDVQKGNLQALQMQAATYAGMVTIFCNRLGWSHLEVLVKGFQKRMIFGISEELVDLVRLPLINGSRARYLFKAGFETISALAGAKVKEISNILRKSLPFQSAKVGNHVEDMKYNIDKTIDRILGPDGKSLSVHESAVEIIKEAQLILQRDLELLGIIWNPPGVVLRLEHDHQNEDESIKKSKDSVSINTLNDGNRKNMEKSIISSEKNTCIDPLAKKNKRGSITELNSIRTISPTKRNFLAKNSDCKDIYEINETKSIYLNTSQTVDEKTHGFDVNNNKSINIINNLQIDNDLSRNGKENINPKNLIGENSLKKVENSPETRINLSKEVDEIFYDYALRKSSTSRDEQSVIGKMSFTKTVIISDSNQSKVNNEKSIMKKIDKNCEELSISQNFDKTGKELTLLDDDSFDLMMKDYKIENDKMNQDRCGREEEIVESTDKKHDFFFTTGENKSINQQSFGSQKKSGEEKSIQNLKNQSNMDTIGGGNDSDMIADRSFELFMETVDNSLEDMVSNIANSKTSYIMTDSLNGTNDLSGSFRKPPIKMSTPIKRVSQRKTVKFNNLSQLPGSQNQSNGEVEFKKPKSILSKKKINKSRRTSVISENQKSLFDSDSIVMTDSNSELPGNESSDLFDSFSTNAKNSCVSEDLFSMEDDGLSISTSLGNSKSSNFNGMVNNQVLVPNTPIGNGLRNDRPVVMRPELSTVNEVSQIQSGSDKFIIEVCQSRSSWNSFLSEFDKWNGSGITESHLHKKLISLALVLQNENSGPIVSGVIIQSECNSSIFLITLIETPSIRAAISFKRRSDFLVNLFSSTQLLLVSFDWHFILSLLGKRLNVNLIGQRMDNLVDLLIMNWMLDSENSCQTFIDLCTKFDVCLNNDDQKVTKCIDFLKTGKENLSLFVTNKEAAIQSNITIDIAVQIQNEFRKSVPSNYRFLKHCFSIEIPLGLLINNISSGFCIDLNVMQEEIGKVINAVNILKEMAFISSGKSFDIDCAKEVSKVIFIDLRMPVRGIYGNDGRVTRRTRCSKLTSSTKKNLQHLISIHPLPAIIIEYRRLKMLVEKTLNPLMESCRKFMSEEEPMRVKCTYQQLTSTGRIISTQPNLQSVPKPISINWFNVLQLQKSGTLLLKKAKELNLDKKEDSPITIFRSCFFASDGCTLVSADYKQLELRILTHLSSDSALMEMFSNQNSFDIFYQMASKWLKKSLQSVTDTDRQRAKQISYGIIYGMSAQGLCEEMEIDDENSAQQMIDGFMTAFPGLKKFITNTIENCRKNGYIETICGRRRFLAEINSTNPYCKAHAERQSVHSTIQGSAADIVKTAMINVQKSISTDFSAKSPRPRKLSSTNHVIPKMVLHLHDELIYEVPVNMAGKMSALLKQDMENAFPLNVALPVSVKSGRRWSELIEIDF